MIFSENAAGTKHTSEVEPKKSPRISPQLDQKAYGMAPKTYRLEL
jgi:hypothetical protein